MIPCRVYDLIAGLQKHMSVNIENSNSTVIYRLQELHPHPKAQCRALKLWNDRQNTRDTKWPNLTFGPLFLQQKHRAIGCKPQTQRQQAQATKPFRQEREGRNKKEQNDTQLRFGMKGMKRRREGNTTSVPRKKDEPSWLQFLDFAHGTALARAPGARGPAPEWRWTAPYLHSSSRYRGRDSARVRCKFEPPATLQRPPSSACRMEMQRHAASHPLFFF